jgi:hypothetical protein
MPFLVLALLKENAGENRTFYPRHKSVSFPTRILIGNNSRNPRRIKWSSAFIWQQF